MFFVRLADCICRIDLDSLGGMFASWIWKLDQYKIHDVPEAEVDFTIRMAKKADLDRFSSEDFCKESVYHEVMGLYELYTQRYETGDYLWTFKRRKLQESILEYRVSGDWKEITILKDASETAGSLAFEYLRFIIQGCLLFKEALTFHGVLLELNGKGIILSADSGVGKTTRARLIRDYKRALILNGDRAVVRKKDGCWTGFSLPWSGSSGEYMNREVPICAIVLVERAEETEVVAAKGIEAFSRVLHYVQAPIWERNLADQSIGLVDEFVGEVPVVRFCSQPTEAAIDALLEKLNIS